MDSPDDSELIGRVLEGDTEAFGEIVTRYQQRLYWVAYQLLGNHEDARDVTQEGFVRAYTKLATFDRTRRFYTWAYRIVSNLAIDRLRARKKMVLSPLNDAIPDDGESPDAGMMGNELRQEVRETLDELPPRYRSLLILRDVEGMSGKAIAEASGVGHATVRWRIHRARKLFREVWERRLLSKDKGNE